MSDGIAKKSQATEDQRFQVWKDGLTAYWTDHYVRPAENLTSSSEKGLEDQICDLEKTVKANWKSASDGWLAVSNQEVQIHNEENFSPKPVITWSHWHSWPYVTYEMPDEN